MELMNEFWKVVQSLELNDVWELRNDRDETCLHIATIYNKINILADLIRYGSNLNDIDHKGDTALHIAIQKDHRDCVSTILNQKVEPLRKGSKLDLNILNFDGYAPLHLAIKNDNLKIVKMLQNKAIALATPIFDVVDGKHGNSALHIAIESDANEVAQYIIQNKLVSPAKSNLSGHTALYLARATNAHDLLQLMQKHGSSDIERCSCSYSCDEDDTSSKDSFDSIDTTATPTSFEV